MRQSSQTGPRCNGGFNGLEDETFQAIKSVFMRLSHSLRRFMRVYAGLLKVHRGLRKVYAAFTQSLRRVYARFMQGLRRVYVGLRKVYAEFTQGLCMVYAGFT